MASGAVEHYLLELNDALVAGAERRDRILAEVEDHLRDATESLVAAGLTADEAQAEAVARFGPAAGVAERFGADPLGRAQQASRWYEAHRIAHPWALPLIAISPWIALTIWATGLSVTVIVFVFVLWSMVARNLDVRERAGGVAARNSARLADRPRLKQLLMQAVTVAALGVMLFVTVPRWTPWFQAIVGYYFVCAVAAFWARPSRCANPACRECSARWTVRHPTTGAAVRYGAWALALAGPALAAIVPVAESRWGTALFAATLFAFAPLPSRRAGTWLRQRRPAIRLALCATPALTLLTINTVVEPVRWILALIVGAIVAYVAFQLEIIAGRNREDETRRRLHARADGLGGGGEQGQPAQPG